MSMFMFTLIVVFLFGLGLLISGNQQLTKDVRTNMSPENIESITEELHSRKIVGQIILVTLAIVFMFYLT